MLDATPLAPDEAADSSRATDATGRFEQLVRTHGPALMRMLPGYEAEPTRREDLRQEILVALWRALPGFRGDCSLRTFVFRVAHNTALRHRRDRARWRRRQPDADDPMPEPPATIDERIEHRQTLAIVHEYMRALPVADRQLLLLYLEGLPVAEIAAVTGLSPTNVTTRSSRLRARLATYIDDRRSQRGAR